MKIEATESENNTKINMFLEAETLQINISREIEIVNEIDYKVTLGNSNNIVLNNLSSAQLSSIFSQLGEKLGEVYVEPLEESIIMPLIMSLVMGSGNDIIIDNGDLTDTEINAFNSKFIVYEGEDIPSEEIKMILNTVYNHNQEQLLGTNDAHYVTITGVVTLEEDATEIEMISGNNYYDVVCKFDEYGFVNEIVITDTSVENEVTEIN